MRGTENNECDASQTSAPIPIFYIRQIGGKGYVMSLVVSSAFIVFCAIFVIASMLSVHCNADSPCRDAAETGAEP